MNALSIAFSSIWAHRTRSALTALGVVIGVFAVVTLISLGAAVNAYVTGQFNQIGARVITVAPALPAAHKAAKPRRRLRVHLGRATFGAPANVPSTLTAQDAAAIAASGGSAIAAAAPLADLPLTVGATPAGSSGLLAIGTTAAYFTLERATFHRGRFDGVGAVLGESAARQLFAKAADPVGRTVYIGGKAFAVAGVLTEVTGLAGSAVDKQVYVPVGRGLAIAHQSVVSQIVVGARTNGDVDAAVTQLKSVMGRRHPTKDFSVTTASSILAVIKSTFATITEFLSGLAAISLLVGGIGIMNIMLVTVTERFREIGIRKALGARDGDILVQFLAESVLLAVLGGGVGVVLSAIASGIVSRAAGLPAGLTVGSVALAIGFSVLVGALFGVLPALRAARLMPAEALRAE